MIKQERFVDDNEGTASYDFIYDIIDKYHLKDYYPEVEIRARLLNYDMMESHPTDDRIIQLVCQNRLLAFVILRRDDWNYTEVTYVFMEDVLKKIEEFDKRVNTKVINKFAKYKNEEDC